jgi:hypothetical protein
MIEIGLLQVLGAMFALFAVSRVVLRYKDKSINAFELIFWSAMWLSVVAVALFPSIFTTLSIFLGIGRGVDTLLYGGMILLFYLLFRLYVRVEEQKKEITALVREIAMEKKKK